MGRPSLRTALALTVLGALARAQGREVAPAPEAAPMRVPLGLPELPAATPADEALATLGQRLFFDPVLSSDRTVSCSSCHDPARAFADSKPLSSGVAGRLTTRNTPVLVNRAYGASFQWDGKSATLEQQALLPIENPLEMDLPLAEAERRLNEDADYRRAFEHALGRAPDRDGLARALAAYVRRQLLGASPVDRFRAGDVAALSDEERAGLWFYESRGGCWRCHSGANFSDEGFHNTGVGARDGVPEEGRAAITARPEDRGRFKTPTLRGVERSAPYMHDGSLATLEDVVEFYRKGGGANPGLDPELAPIEMSATDARNLVAFLRALSRTTSETGGPR